MAPALVLRACHGTICTTLDKYRARIVHDHAGQSDRETCIFRVTGSKKLPIYAEIRRARISFPVTCLLVSSLPETGRTRRCIIVLHQRGLRMLATQPAGSVCKRPVPHPRVNKLCNTGQLLANRILQGA
jgi:hypothetical protein